MPIDRPFAIDQQGIRVPSVDPNPANRGVSYINVPRATQGAAFAANQSGNITPERVAELQQSLSTQGGSYCPRMIDFSSLQLGFPNPRHNGAILPGYLTESSRPAPLMSKRRHLKEMAVMVSGFGPKKRLSMWAKFLRFFKVKKLLTNTHRYYKVMMCED